MRAALATTIALISTLLLFSCFDNEGTGPAPSELAGRITIDSVSALNGEEVRLAVRLKLAEDGNQIDSLRQYLFQIAYDQSVLTFLSAEQGDADSSWDYFNWRVSGVTALRREIYVMAARVTSPSRNFAPTQGLPEGVLFWLNFAVNPNSDLIGAETEVNFSTETCLENALVDGTDETLLHIARYQRMNDSVISTLDTMWCPRHYALSPDLEFVSGAVKILRPPDPGPPVTVNLEPVLGSKGDTVVSELTIDYRTIPPYVPSGFGGFSFFLEYDSTLMTVIDVSRGNEIVEWEYFSWRPYVRDCPYASCQRHPGVSIVSILEMNDGTPSNGDVRPQGPVARIQFTLREDVSVGQACTLLHFQSNDDSYNVLSDLGGDIIYGPDGSSSAIHFGPAFDLSTCPDFATTCVDSIRFEIKNCPGK